VRAIDALWTAGIRPTGLAHITSDGLANLCRLNDRVGYRIETLPEPPAIFRLIRDAGGVDDAEMYRVFNMGVGFVVVVAPDDVTAALASLRSAGYGAHRIGRVDENAGEVRIEPVGLTGTLDAGESHFRRS
jgi:phosphoribosylformylglycinamidine cyclo-ligase